MSLSGKTVLITGASMGIGAAIARRLAHESATLILLSRSADKLSALAATLRATIPAAGPIHTAAADVRHYDQLSAAITSTLAAHALPRIDILVNNAGLALGAPAPFASQSLADIDATLATNVNGVMYAAHAALNAGGMLSDGVGAGTIVTITSVTGLETPPFPGEAAYHASKAAQEAFTNALRNELRATNVRVLAVRPGVVATHFHEQRVGYDRGLYEGFVDGYEPLVAEDVAEAVAWVLGRPERVAVKALDVVPTAQRCLGVFDREWNARNGV